MQIEGTNSETLDDRRKQIGELTKRSLKAVLIRNTIFRKRESRKRIVRSRKTRLY